MSRISEGFVNILHPETFILFTSIISIDEMRALFLQTEFQVFSPLLAVTWAGEYDENLLTIIPEVHYSLVDKVLSSYITQSSPNNPKLLFSPLTAVFHVILLGPKGKD